MSADNSNRYRVSTNFIIIKLFLCFAILIVAAYIINDILNGSITFSMFMPLAFSILSFGGLLYFVVTRNIFEYDEKAKMLYVFDYKRKTEKQIPVEKIDKILYSSVGFGNGSHSYLIVYSDSASQKQKVRLFPIPFNNDINTIITDAKLSNPNLVTRNWSFGVNEFLD